jgi:hypothetical protein
MQTLAHRRELCFWGWAYTDEGLSQAEEGQVARLALDPQGMMNPGVLIDTPTRGATAGGSMTST